MDDGKIRELNRELRRRRHHRLQRGAAASTGAIRVARMVHPPFKMAQMALDADPKSPDDDWRDADTPSFFAAEWRLCMLLALVAYVATLGVVFGFAAHSVRRHGWRRRTLRRYSYVLFLSFTLCRALGCALSLLQPAPSDAWQAARPLVMPPWPLAIDRLAFCSYFGGFSLLVCGWADSACAAACPRLPAPRAAGSKPRNTGFQSISTRQNAVFAVMRAALDVVRVQLVQFDAQQ